MGENPQEKNAKLALGYIGFAQVYINQKDYPEALKNLEKALKLTPKNRDIWFLMGDVCRFTGRDNDALDFYRKANEMSEDAETHHQIGYIMQNRLKDYTKALESYRKAVELEPNFKGTWVNMGNIYEKLKNFDESLKCYEESLKIDPNYAIAINNLGWLYEKLKNDIKMAISYYEKAIEADPKYAQPRINLAQHKKPKKETAEDWNYEGNVYFNKKNYKEALKHFKKATELKPGERLYLHNVGKAYHWLRKNKDAIKYFEKANAISPHLDTYLHMGYAYRNLKKYKKAMECVKKAEEDNQHNYLVTNEIGIILLRQGNYVQAHEYFKRTTELKADYKRGWYNLGLTYKKLGEFYKAINAWLKALNIDPNYHLAKKAAGTLLRERPYIKDDILAAASGKFDEYLKK